MTVSSAHTLLWGLSTELPDPTDPHLPREGISPLSYLCVDTLQVFQSFLDGPWLLTVTLPGSDLHRASGAPVDGTTLAGIAEPGALLVTDEPALYQNTGTKDSPVWTVGASTVAATTFTAAPTTFKSDAADHIAVIDQAAAGQAVSIHEFRDSTGQILAEIDAHGNIVAVALTPPAAPTKGAKTAGDITGTAYQWACTLVNAQGETTLGMKTSTTALTAQQQSLTMPATVPDGCTFNLYRNASTGSTWEQVTTGLAAGAVYVDDTLDIALGSAAPTTNTTAPGFTIGGLTLAVGVVRGPGGAVPSITIQQTDSGQTGYLAAFLDATGATKVSIARDGEIVSTDDFIALGAVKANESVTAWGTSIQGAQPVLATGAAHTADDVIAFLQSLGFCKQS